LPEGRPAAALARAVGPAIAGVVVLAVALGIVAVRTVMRTATDQVSDQSVAPRQRVGTDPGAQAPEFTAAPYRGRDRLTLAQFRGHPVVLNFWASWCPPCRAEMPALEAAYERYRARGVVVIGIDGRTDTWGVSRAFLDARGVTYPVGRDEAGRIAEAYHVAGLPTTFFIAADGRVASVALQGGFTGPDGRQELDKQIEALLH
jgi:cytochrome c biogenesis protein CcmG, thiol:disulfide interchange protein DsbE